MALVTVYHPHSRGSFEEISDADLAAWLAVGWLTEPPLGWPGGPAPDPEWPALDAVVAAVVADPTTDAHAAVDTAVTQAVQDHTPGIELGAVLRTSNFTTTNTSSGSAAGDIPSFSIAVVGKGRPVDIRFFAYAAYHSVASTGVAAVLCVNGSPTSANSQIGSVISPSTSNGPSLNINHRTGVLTDGVTYTFTVRVWGLAAGTCNLLGAAFAPIEFTATSR